MITIDMDMAKNITKEKLQLEQALKEALDKQINLDFTKEELAFILSRVHPDKNPDSKIATTLTSKLIKGRK